MELQCYTLRNAHSMLGEIDGSSSMYIWKRWGGFSLCLDRNYVTPIFYGNINMTAMQDSCTDKDRVFHVNSSCTKVLKEGRDRPLRKAQKSHNYTYYITRYNF